MIENQSNKHSIIVKAIEDAMKLDPRNPHCWIARAFLYLKLRDRIAWNLSMRKEFMVYEQKSRHALEFAKKLPLNAQQIESIKMIHKCLNYRSDKVFASFVFGCLLIVIIGVVSLFFPQ